jgi:hypothetical protein
MWRVPQILLSLLILKYFLFNWAKTCKEEIPLKQEKLDKNPSNLIGSINFSMFMTDPYQTLRPEKLTANTVIPPKAVSSPSLWYL